MPEILQATFGNSDKLFMPARQDTSLPFLISELILFRYEDSEKRLETALTLYHLSAPPKSNYTMFAKSVQAIVLKVLGKTSQTILTAKEVIQDTGEGQLHVFEK